MSNRLSAVINCGSSSIRLVVAEFSTSGEPRVLDQAIHYLSLGRDVFTGGFIKNKTLVRALEIFNLYSELLRGYGIKPSSVNAIGTAAVREALNRENFVDRIEIRTGFRIRIIDGLEENRLSYMAVLYALKDRVSEVSKGNVLIMEVSGGTTEVILLKKGAICAVHSLSFGTIRIEEINRLRRGISDLKSAELEQTITPMRELILEDLKQGVIQHVIFLGNYARLAAELVGRPMNNRILEVTRSDWDDLALKFYRMPPEESVRKLGVAAAAAEGMGTALLAYQFFLQGIPAEKIWVPTSGISEGLLMEIRPGADPEIQNRFWNQVRASAVSLGKKYHFDAEHSKVVTELSLQIFDQLQHEHQMNLKHRLLLEIAAILHDIGTFVKPSAHHKHGQYLVENSEVFGLDSHDLKVIGNIVRYHRKSGPLPSHLGFVALTREDRLTVMKLASILRVADALDRGHKGKVKDLKAVINGEVLELIVDVQVDISAEKLSLADKGTMFEEVYGYTPRTILKKEGKS